MVETLSVISAVLVLILAVSMLIPTRQRHYSEASSSCEDKSISPQLSQLIFQFAIESWKARNTLRNQFDPSSNGFTNSIWNSLWKHCEEVVPLSWIEPKANLLTRQSFYSLCAPGDEKGDPTAWCFYAIWGSLSCDDPAALTDLQKELGMREMAKQWSPLLGNFGLVAADENDCLWLAMPYIPASDSTTNTVLARSIYSQLKAIKVDVNGVSQNCDCLIRFAETGLSSTCEQTLKLLMEKRGEESPIEFYDGQRWHAIDLQAPPESNPFAQPRDRNNEMVEASPAQLSQFLSDIKSKPAAMCVKDDASDLSTQYGVQIEACDDIDETPLNVTEAKPAAPASDQELASIESSVQEDLAGIKQDVDAAVAASTPAAEVGASEQVTADDIAQLFAAARANA